MYVFKHDVPLVVVNDFYVACISVVPHEADPPLIVDSNAVLAAPVAFQLLQTIRRWKSQVINDRGCVKHSQLTASALLNLCRQALSTPAMENGLSALVAKRSNHGHNYNVSRYITQCVIPYTGNP
jgi:hypothetical protein